jgi:DNA-binding transcriptional LysR family regulator
LASIHGIVGLSQNARALAFRPNASANADVLWDGRPALNRLLSFESFVTAVQAGSISAAAERLGTTKSNVSRRVAELEAHLGVRLLNRNPRRLGTTDAGGEFYEEVCKLLSELKRAEERVSDNASEPRGVLRVSAPTSLGTLHLKSLVADLMLRHPQLSLDLDLDDRIVDLVTDGFDCAVRLGELKDSSLVARHVAPRRLLICASPEYLERRGEPSSPDELQDHDGLHYSRREPNLMWRLQRCGEPASYRVGHRMRCNNGEMLQQAALAGLGLAILPTFMAAPHLLSGRLRPVLRDCSPAGGSITVVFARNKQPSIKLRALIDGMLETYSPVASWDREIEQLLQ